MSKTIILSYNPMGVLTADVASFIKTMGLENAAQWAGYEDPVTGSWRFVRQKTAHILKRFSAMRKNRRISD